MSDPARLPVSRPPGLEPSADHALFSRVTLLASTMLGCPIALLSIIGEEGEERVLGSTGLGLAETERDVSFCTICTSGEAPLLVADTRADPRLRDDPLVTGAPFIRSCLGVPIPGEGGVRLGALCVMSTAPDAFRQDQSAPLAMLAELAGQSIAFHARTRALGLANAQLKQASQVFRQAERATNIGSWRVELATGRLFWTDQVYRINGLEPGRPVTVEEAVALYRPEDRAMVSAALANTIARGTSFAFETSIIRSDGKQRRIRVVGERVDVDGVPDSVAGIIHDCTEEHLRNAALKRAAEHDRLTGLFNRASFDRKLGAAMHRADREPVMVALLDLDGFKDVNDTLGHLVGDRVLVAVAAHLHQRLGRGMFLARWGGDEFALLFPPSMTLAAARAFLEQRIGELDQVVALGNSALTIGATCGLARIDRPDSGEEIMRRADLALYRGKELGRGHVVCWDKEIEARQSERQRAIARLRAALNERRAIAAYQPIVELASGQIVSLEALLRLRDADGRLIAASEIFSALLDPELSRRVSRLMLDSVIADAPAILALLGPKVQIAINLSEADLSKDDFVHHLIAVVDDSPLTPRNFTIEVTETMLLDACGQLRQSLAMLDACGFTICLDDFGSGFSSLTHLRQFPIHKVKIDRDFIAGITQDHQSRLIIQAIVQMGHSLGLKVVVEGVESEEQERFLRAIGCRHVQGYRYGRPMPIDGLPAELGLMPAARRISA
ncbi:MAG: putative bifunctional diguanylate cyclase/phosphodiesterase [Erythrobacter sp.]